MPAFEILTEKEFRIAEAHRGVTVIDFYRQDCGPCKLMAPVIDALSNTFEQVTVVKVDVARLPAVAAKYRITTFPTIYILKDGMVLSFFTGRRPAQWVRDQVQGALA